MRLPRTAWLQVFALFFAIAHFVPSHETPYLMTNDHLGSKSAHNSTSDINDLRLVAFGTSRTYGSGLGHERKEKAYPHLLSKDANNLAIRAAGPQYPALCTYSMLSEEHYDVILLEYNMKADEHLLRLSQRLRDRFPDATIVFLQLWMPFLYYDPSSRLNLKQIVEQSNISRTDYQPHHLYSMVKQTDTWIFDDFDSSNRIESIAERVGAHIYHLPQPESANDAIREYGHYFNYDLVHFSEDGHAALARGLNELLQSINATRSDRVHEWRDVDTCHSWYETGVTTVKHSDGMEMSQFAKKKFGLEVTPPISWLTIDNPFSHPAEIFMSYMVTAPHQDYPAVSVDLIGTEDSAEDDMSTITTTIVPKDKTNRYAVHVVKTAFLGIVPPMGKRKVKITPLETGRNSPFRITGIMMTSTTDPLPPIEVSLS